MSKDNSDFFEAKSEWSKIKDSLLAYYLPPYVSKILMTHKPLIYVDGFAGPGQFKDGNEGSPLIASRIIDERLLASNAVCPKVLKIFIETEHCEQLRDNLASFNPLIYETSFADLPAILEEQGVTDANLFLYIDPFGIKYLDMGLFHDLVSIYSSVEVLVNFNSFGFVREACRVYGAAFDDLPEDDLPERDPWDIASTEETAKRLSTIIGGTEWQGIISDYKIGAIKGRDVESEIACLYSDYLKTMFEYVLNFPVRLKAGNHPKYRMFHASNHHDGAILMYETMGKEKTDLLFLQSDGQTSLFDQTIENELIDRNDVKNKLFDFAVRIGHRISLSEFYASFVSSLGVTLPFADLRELLCDLEREGKVRIIRNPSHTKNGKPSKFMAEDHGNKAWIEVSFNDMQQDH